MAQRETSIKAGAIAQELRPRPSVWKRLATTARHKPLGAVSAIIIIILVAMAISADVIAPYPPNEVHAAAAFKSPGAVYQGTNLLFGADELGRDIFSRILYGARISLWVGVMAVGLGVSSGSVVGLISGFFEGKVDIVIQRIVDTVMAFPALILALALMAMLGPSITNVMIAVAVAIAPADSRIVRGAVLSVKQNAYVDAARCIGATNMRILFRHILPNVTAPILIIASVWLGNAIILEASLSFLGVGTPPPNPSWGAMLSSSGRTYMERAPHIAIFPGLAISMVVLSFNLLGDTLRDIWDPRLRGSQ